MHSTLAIPGKAGVPRAAETVEKTPAYQPEGQSTLQRSVEMHVAIGGGLHRHLELLTPLH